MLCVSKLKSLLNKKTELIYFMLLIPRTENDFICKERNHYTVNVH